MNAMAAHDTLTVVNGPEDGTEFVLTNRSTFVGADPSCAVNIRLDGNVLPLHGRVHAVSDGYQFRGAHGARVIVNGKPAGVIRSRVLRHGEIVRIGETDLALTCSPGGLAQRSRGLTFENDAVWAVRETFGFAFTTARRLLRFAAGVPRFVRRRPFWVAGGLVALAYWRMPVVRGVLDPILAQIRAAF